MNTATHVRITAEALRDRFQPGSLPLISFKGGQKFRETFYQFMTAFSLPWYAVIGVSAALSAGLPDIGAIAIGVVGPTAGRFLIDITADKSAKQFVRGEWFVGTAVLTSIVYLILFKYLALTVWPATLIAFAVGFLFRVGAIWYCWDCLLYTSPSPRDRTRSRMPSSA